MSIVNTILDNLEYILLMLLAAVALFTNQHVDFAVFFTGALLVKTIKESKTGASA